MYILLNKENEKVIDIDHIIRIKFDERIIEYKEDGVLNCLFFMMSYFKKSVIQKKKEQINYGNMYVILNMMYIIFIKLFIFIDWRSSK